MKQITSIFFFLFSLLLFVSAGFTTYGTEGLIASAAIAAASIIVSTPSFFVAHEGILKEIWLNMIKENFYRDSDFLNGVQDMSSFVENDKINLADAGADPAVLVNNTTYPVDTSERTDTAIALELDQLDTENTIVRHAEQVQLAYDKLASVVRSHKKALRQACLDRAAHAYSPASDAVNTPVIRTTGADRTIAGLTGNFKRLTIDDITKLATAFDSLSFPKEGRVIVLDPRHKEDLIQEDKDLFKQFVSLPEGKVLRYMGFEFHDYAQNARYNKSTGAKVAFGAAAAAATDTISSFAFVKEEMMKADGTYDMFYRPKFENPEGRGDVVGFQKRFLALPIRNKCNAALISDAGE